MSASYVYCLEFANGKKYVGVSVNPGRRYMEHRGSGTPCGLAFRKHGDPKLRVLVKADRAYCMELEAKLTDAWQTVTPHGYNLRRGGLGGSVPCSESRSKMSQARLGKHHTEQTRERMKIAQSRRLSVSDETRKRMSDAAKKRGLSKTTLRAAAEANRGPHSIERRQLQSIRMKSWWASRKQEGSL